MLSVPQTQTKRAALYPRVSTAPQAKSKHASSVPEDTSDAEKAKKAKREQETSLDTQEAAMRAYAAERGYAVEHVLAEVHTGVELWERPQLSKLRELVRDGAVDVVIAYAIDRLARDPVHLGVILSEAQHHGVAVEFVTEPLDDSPESHLIRFVRGYAAKIEHEKIRERVIRGKRARVAAGNILPGGGKPRYGYRWTAERTRYDVDQETAPVVARIAADCIAGQSIRRIVLNLQEDGIASPHGGTRWSCFTVRQILTHPIYRGQARGWRGEIALPVGVAPALIGQDEARAIDDRLATNKQAAARHNARPEESLLRAGFVVCGICGRTMHFGRRAGRPGQYRCDAARHGAPTACRQTLSQRAVDAAIWRKVSLILSRPDVVARELALLRADDPTGVDVAAVDKSLAGVDRQMRLLVEQLSHVEVGSAVADIVMEKLKQLEQNRAQLVAEREAVLGRMERWVTLGEQLEGLEAWCRRMADRLATMSYAEKRDALFMLGLRVRSWPQGHPDTPPDADRYVVDASIPLEELARASIVFSASRSAGHNTLPLRWTDRHGER